MTKLREVDVQLDQLRQFNDAAFHQFAPVRLGKRPFFGSFFWGKARWVSSFKRWSMPWAMVLLT